MGAVGVESRARLILFLVDGGSRTDGGSDGGGEDPWLGRRNTRLAWTRGVSAEGAVVNAYPDHAVRTDFRDALSARAPF